MGRVAYIAFGPNAGKLVTIVDVIDQNRVRIVVFHITLMVPDNWLDN